MAQKICPSCNGSGHPTVFDGQYPFIDTKQNCSKCWGTGFVTVKDPTPPSTTRTSNNTISKPSTNNSDKESGNILQGLVALTGLIISGLVAYDISDENLVATLITGFIGGAISAKLYKFILFVIIVGVLYYLYAEQ